MKNLIFKFQIPFRDAHATAGKVVALAEQKSQDISTLNLDDLKSIR